MLRPVFLSIIVGCLAIKSGCSSPSETTTSVGSANAPSHPVARVVYEFLDAVRRGDTEVASGKLTALALQKTSEMDLSFSPPGSDTARFEVGEVEMIDNDKAVVECVWSDLDADGQPSEEKITWALKLADGSWRISGMAAEIGPNEPPVIMDFENPGQLLSPAPSTTAGARQADVPQQASQPAQDPFRTLPR